MFVLSQILCILLVQACDRPLTPFRSFYVSNLIDNILHAFIRKIIYLLQLAPHDLALSIAMTCSMRIPAIQVYVGRLNIIEGCSELPLRGNESFDVQLLFQQTFPDILR